MGHQIQPVQTRPIGAPDRRWQFVARLVWLALAALTLGLTVAGVPARWFELVGGNCATLAGGAAGAQWCAGYLLIWELLLVGGLFTAALVLFRARTDAGMALLLGLVLLAAGATAPGMTDALIKADNPYGVPALAWPVLALRAAASVGLLVLFYTLPDGRFVPAWTSWLALAWLGLHLLWLAWPQAPGNTIYGDGWSAHLAFSVVHYLLWLASGVSALLWRYRVVVDTVQRQQIKWVLFGLALAPLGALLYFTHSLSLFGLPDRHNLYDLLTITPLWVLMFGGGLACLSVAIVRHRLWDIDRLINRTLVYGSLSLAVVGLYVLIVTLLSALLPAAPASLATLVATGLVAVLFQPLRERLQGAVNRVMFGERDAPEGALGLLGRQLEGTVSPETVLTTIATTVGRALKIPYVAVELSGADGRRLLAASYGAPETPALSLPLVYQREPVGLLLLAPRAPGESFSAADRRTLDYLVTHAGMALYAVRLTRELQQSRERLRGSLEDVRRRVRQNLHDGIGPALASQQFTLDTIVRLLPSDPTGAAYLLQALREQSQTIIGDLRLLVEDLRPPALDDLGLIGALRERLARYEHAPLRIGLEAPEQLPALSAAVEVAAYYICLEAVTNVVRHAGASSCQVQIAVVDALQLAVADNGRGLPPELRAGEGLRSMRERAEELGGRCTVRPRPGGGTLMLATLPLTPTAPEDKI